jgi:hypothetical protein
VCSVVIYEKKTFRKTLEPIREMEHRKVDPTEDYRNSLRTRINNGCKNKQNKKPNSWNMSAKRKHI